MHHPPSSKAARAAVLGSLLSAVLLAGCLGPFTPAQKPVYNAEPIPNSHRPAPDELPSALTSAIAGPARCIACATGRAAPPVGGATKSIGNRRQLIAVRIVGGYYTPNVFRARRGIPLVVVFSGNATGCIAHPTFRDLGKVGEIENGAATVDLGPLDPGTYTFSCSMGSNVGTIDVR